LSVLWRARCPAPDLLDASVAGPASDQDEQDRAEGMERLLQTLHTPLCAQCRDRLQHLQDALTAFDPEALDPDLLVLDAWHLELLSSWAPVRGPEDKDAPLTAELPDEDQFRTLVGRARLERERRPRITIDPDPAAATGTRLGRVTLVLPAPAAAHVEHILAVLGVSDDAQKVPLRFTDEERLVLQGTCTLPAPPAADTPLQLAVRVVLRPSPPGAGEGQA
jgi:hypothetical protein